MKINCKHKAETIKERVADYITIWDFNPSLHIIQVGNNEESNRYIRGKLSDCKEVGIECELHKLDENISESDLIILIETLNNKINTGGIIVQLPLPKHINPDNITKVISKEKDVDGFKTDSLFTSCTAKGVIEALSDYDLDGKNVTLVGRSDLVGKPLIPLLLNKNCNLTICHSHTKEEDLATYLRNSDVVITAIGKRNIVQYEHLKTGSIIIDVGINFDENGKLCGDFYHRDFATIYENKFDITPVPGGVGLLTRAMLLENTLEAYKLNMERV